MSWLRSRLQLLKTPEEYLLQLVASADTPMGLDWMASAIAVHPLGRLTLVIWKDPVVALQPWLWPLQGQSASVVIPLSLTKARPQQLNPPLHPQFPYFLEQSTNCCSERNTFYPLPKAHDSKTPTALKAQQDPQLPWFFTAETIPLVVQSMSALMAAISTSQFLWMLGLVLGLRQIVANSPSVRPLNWLMPILQVCELSELCRWIIQMFLAKTSLRQTSSSAVQAMLNFFFQRRNQSSDD